MLFEDQYKKQNTTTLPPTSKPKSKSIFKRVRSSPLLLFSIPLNANSINLLHHTMNFQMEIWVVASCTLIIWNGRSSEDVWHQFLMLPHIWWWHHMTVKAKISWRCHTNGYSLSQCRCPLYNQYLEGGSSLLNILPCHCNAALIMLGIIQIL